MSEAAARAGTLIVRGECVVYASDGLAALAGRAVREIVGGSPLDLLVPEDRPRLVALRARGAAGEPVPSSLELTLLLPDGARQPVECQVDADGPELIVHLRDLGAREARRLRLEALAAVAAEIRNERSVEAVHARVRSELEKLGVAAAMLRHGAAGAQVVWISVPEPLRAEVDARTGGAPEGFTGPLTAFGRAVVADGGAFTDRWAADVAAFVPPGLAPAAHALLHREGFSRAVGVRVEAPGEGALHLVVAAPWLRGEDVPAMRLFGAQVAAALDAARTIADLSRRNATLGVLARIAELAGEATDLAAFFARASEVLRPVAGYAGCAIYVPDEAGGALLRVYSEGGPPEHEERSERLPLAGPLGDVVRERVPRVTAVPYPGGDPEHTGSLGFEALAWIPLVSQSRGVGALVAGFRGDEALARAAVDLLCAVGAHFASAITSHGLLGDLRRRLGELTLLVDVARASAQLDPALLLDASLRRICDTIGADAGAAFLRDGDRLVLLSATGLDPACAQAVAQLEASDGAPGLAMTRRAPVLAASGDAFGGRCPHFGAAGAGGAVIAVPLLAKAEAVGALVLGRSGGAPFSEGDSALLSSIGVQLGLAVDAARLFSDVRRRLSDLEAVHALALRVFANAPGDARALLQDACKELVQALSARAAAIFVPAGDGTLRVGASVGLSTALGGVTVDLGRDGVSKEVMRTRLPVVSEDVTRDPRSQLRGRADIEPLAVLAVPLASRQDVRGVVYIGDRAGRTFSQADVALANALAGALGVGVENAELYADARRRVDELSLLNEANARLYLETRRRAEELGLLHEVGRSLVETLDIEQVLSAGVRNLARIVDAPDAYLALATPDGAHLELRAVAGARRDRVGQRVPLEPPTPLLATLVYRLREPILVEDALTDPRVADELRLASGARAYLGLPLIVRDQVIGTAVIVETRGPRLFTPAEVERAAAIANQLAVAADNARLYEDLRRSYADLARAQQQLIQGERLAALGELSAVVAHEVRNPLGVIFNSIGSLRRLVRPSGDAKMLFDIVEEEADRLNRIVGDLLDFARPSTPQVRPESLDRVVEDAVGAALAQHGAGVELARDLDPELPPVAIDARLVRQAVLNVAVNAVQAMPRGGRITIRTRREPTAARVEIEDTGAGIPDEVRERIFEPFFTTKASGTGLGLAVVRRIVEGHGGQVAVRSTPGSGTIFVLRFPLGGPPVENGAVMR